MRTVAVIQARMGSSRLPGKSMLCLRGRPLIDWVVERTRRASLLDEVVVACPDTRLDDPLAFHLSELRVRVVRGAEEDVLGRFVLAARETKADQVVRICADNPFVWWEAIDRLVRFHAESGADCSYNHIPKGNLWPDGLGAEIVSADLLGQLAAKAKDPSEREHCLNYLWNHREDYAMATFDPEEQWLRRPDIRLDVDTLEDFVNVSELTASLFEEAEELVTSYDTVCALNAWVF